MPVSPLIPAIIGSIIESIVDQPPMPQPGTGWPMPGIVRNLPADSLYGEMAPPVPGAVQIDGRILPLSMAAQFRNENDAIVMPGNIRQPVPVRYMMDGAGTVYRVWILSPAELAATR